MNDNNAENKLKIIFHIGDGKTGSSSIQYSLNKSRQLLNSQGYYYFGVMLEHAPEKIFHWQNASATKDFIALSDIEANNQLSIVFEKSINALNGKGIHTIIWSNEWFFSRHEKVIQTLKKLLETGVDVKIIAYIRSHVNMSRSKYIQWGIKHKTYRGPLITFNEFIRRRPVKYFSKIQSWVLHLNEKIHIYNYDSIDDVVEHFAKITGLSPYLQSSRVNEPPIPEELFLRALFNNSVDSEATPIIFDSIFESEQLDFNLTLQDCIRRLISSSDYLLDASEFRKDKIDLSNETSNSIYSKDEYSTYDASFGSNNDRFSAILAQIVIDLSKRIFVLERNIRKSQNSTNSR